MADDNVFEGQGEPVEQVVAPREVATQEDFSTFREEMTRGFQQFGQQVAQAIQRPRAQEAAPAEESGDESADQFVRRLTSEALSEDLKPTTEAIQNDLIQDRFRELQADFDGEFGEGQFRELIQDDLAVAVQALPKPLRSSRSHTTMLLRGLKGGLSIDKLGELKAENMKRKEDLSAPRMLSGTGLPKPKGSKVSPEEKDFLKALSDGGDDYTMADYMADRDSPNTEEEYMASITPKQGTV